MKGVIDLDAYRTRRKAMQKIRRRIEREELKRGTEATAFFAVLNMELLRFCNPAARALLQAHMHECLTPTVLAAMRRQGAFKDTGNG